MAEVPKTIPAESEEGTALSEAKRNALPSHWGCLAKVRKRVMFHGDFMEFSWDFVGEVGVIVRNITRVYGVYI